MINKKNIRLIILVMIISLSGLIGIQIYWILGAIELEEQRFESTVNNAIRNVAELVERQEVAHNVRKRFEFSRQGKTFFMGIDSVIRKSINRNDSTTSGLVFWNEISPGELQTEFRQFNRDGSVDVIEEIKKDSSGDIIYKKFRKARQTEGAPTFTDLNSKIQKHGKGNPQLERLMKKSGLVSDVFRELYNLNINSGVEDRVNPKLVDSLLRAELKLAGINTKYEFGLYDFMNNKMFVDHPTKYTTELMKTPFRVRLFPNDIFYHPDFLMVFFPEQNKYVYTNLWIMFTSSTFFTFIIIFIFYFTINTIIRQKRLSEIKNDFINNMTHELKTPIATISLACEALSDPDLRKLPDADKKYTKMIRAENNRLGQLVETVLQSAMLESSDFELNTEPLNIHQVIMQVKDSMQMHIDQKSGKFILELNAQDYIIDADKTHITNMINNLIDNAIKYTPEIPEIRIETKNIQGNIIISVSDNGIGIMRDQQKKIFEKLYRVPTGNLHDVKGFGLGLNYVKAVVEKHKGQIKLESEHGVGSKFSVILPLYKTR